jgi:hypothetical protein
LGPATHFTRQDGCLRDDDINLRIRCRLPTETEAHGAQADLLRHAHGREHRRKLDPAGMARRTRRCRDAVESCYLRADHADEGHVEGVRQAMLGMAVQHNAIAEVILQRAPEAIPQRTNALHRRQILR